MVADNGQQIARHGRMRAAAMQDLKDVPVIRLSLLDKTERRVYRIADNKLIEQGEWDEAMLRDEVTGLPTEDIEPSRLCIAAISGLFDGEYCSQKAGPKPVQNLPHSAVNCAGKSNTPSKSGIKHPDAQLKGSEV